LLSKDSKFAYLLKIALVFYIVPFAILATATWLPIDFAFFYDICGLAISKEPYIGFWTPYPPLYYFIYLGLFKIVSGNPTQFYYMFLGIILVFSLGNLFLVYKIARKIYDEKTASKIALIYIFFSLPFHWGSVYTAQLDIVPTFFLLLSIFLFLKKKFRFAALASGVGFAMKIFPIVAILPILKLKQINWSEKIQCCLLALLPLAVSIIPYVARNSEMALSWFWFLANWHNVPFNNLFALIAGNYGAGYTPTLSELTVPIKPTFQASGWIPYLALGCLALVFLLSRVEDGVSAVRFTSLIILLLAFFISFEVQFLYWIIPIVLLTYIPRVTVLSLVFLEASGIMLMLATVTDHWILIFSVIIRTFVFIMLIVAQFYKLELFKRATKPWVVAV